jgi:hypothetical protein
MGYLTGFVGLVALVQGVAWISGARVGRRRRVQGAVLAPVGLAVVAASLLHLLVPGFF